MVCSVKGRNNPLTRACRPQDDVFVSTSGRVRSNYDEWEAKLTRSAFGVDWGLSYVATDLSKSECASYYGYTDVCSATVVVSASKTF